MQRLASAGALAVIGLLVLADAPANAQPRHDRRGKDAAERMVTEHAEELGLDSATQNSIRAIVERTREEAQKVERAHHRASGTLEQLLELDEPNVGSVMKQSDVVGELESQRRKVRLQGMLEIRALLTREQREKLVEIRNTRRADRRERMKACRSDGIRLCPGATRPRKVLQCLQEHSDELSNECSEAFDGLVEQMTQRRGGRPPSE